MITCLMWSAVVYSLVWIMSEVIDKTHTQHGRTYLRKPPSPNRPHGPPNRSIHQPGTMSPSGDSCSNIRVSMDPEPSSGESTQTNQTVRNGEAGFDSGTTRRRTSWIISHKVMTVVLVGEAFTEEGVLSEWPCFTPYPASASRFRTVPGPHPLESTSPQKDQGRHDERYHELHDIHVFPLFRHFGAIGFSSRGRWVKRGGVTPNDAYRFGCRGREGSHPCIVLADGLALRSRTAHLTPNNVSDARLMVVYRRSKEIRWK